MMFIMRAATCSGKDTFISEHFTDPTAIFSSDQFRMMMCGSMQVQQFNKQVFETMHNIIEFRLANKVAYTVYNATNMRFKDAAVVVELCKKYHVPYVFISIAPPDLEELHRRNSFRFVNYGQILIPDGIVNKHFERYESCKGRFIEEATYSKLCKFIEIDQNYEVICEV